MLFDRFWVLFNFLFGLYFRFPLLANPITEESKTGVTQEGLAVGEERKLEELEINEDLEQ